MPLQEMAPPVLSQPRPAIRSLGKVLRGWCGLLRFDLGSEAAVLATRCPAGTRGRAGSWRSLWRVWTPGNPIQGLCGEHVHKTETVRSLTSSELGTFFVLPGGR